MGALSTLTVSTFYMIAQMVGAGALVSLLLKDTGIDYHTAVIGVGILMIVYVVFGGMLATTWVQIVKAMLLMGGTILLSFLVLRTSTSASARSSTRSRNVTHTDAQGNRVTQDFLTPGLRYAPPYGRARSDLARHGADLRDGGSAAHPRPLLHRARREDGSQQRRLGDADHRHLLHHDDVLGLRRRDDRRPRFHRRATAART